VLEFNSTGGVTTQALLAFVVIKQQSFVSKVGLKQNICIALYNMSYTHL